MIMKARGPDGKFIGHKYRKIDGVWYKGRCGDCHKLITSRVAKRCFDCQSKLSTMPKLASGYSYMAIHTWLARHFGRADHCENRECDGRSRVFEWANLSKTYPKDITDYRQLCKGCHIRFDRWHQNLRLS